MRAPRSMRSIRVCSAAPATVLRTDHCWSNFCRIILITMDGSAMFNIPVVSPMRISMPIATTASFGARI